MANCSSRKKGETEQEYRRRCGGYTYTFPIDLVQKEEPPKEQETPVSEPPAPEPPAPEGDVSEARHTKGNIYKGKLKVDGNPVQVEVELVGVDNRTRSYLVRVIHIDRKYLSYLPKTGIIPIPARIFDIPGGGWVKVKTQGQFEGKLTEMSTVALTDIDKFADKQLNPINVVLTDKHFFDRLQDPRNQKDISSAELIGFFKRLGKNKNKFIEFLNQYGEIVAKDNKTKINIPFMKKANKVIAKTIMRKSNFVTSSPEYTFETIKKVDGKWVVYPKSGGDRLGTHTTYKDALKQLQAIEASKARNEDVFPGGLADKYSLGDLAKSMGWV